MNMSTMLRNLGVNSAAAVRRSQNSVRAPRLCECSEMVVHFIMHTSVQFVRVLSQTNEHLAVFCQFQLESLICCLQRVRVSEWGGSEVSWRSAIVVGGGV